MDTGARAAGRLSRMAHFLWDGGSSVGRVLHVHTQIDRGPCTPGAVSLACRQRAQRDFKLDAGGCAWFRARASTPAGSRLPSRQLNCQQYLRDARRPAGYRRGRKRHATQKRVRIVHSSIAHGEFAVMIAWSSLLRRCLLTAANNDGAAPLSRPAKLLTEMSAFRFYRHRDTCLASDAAHTVAGATPRMVS